MAIQDKRAALYVKRARYNLDQLTALLDSWVAPAEPAKHAAPTIQDVMEEVRNSDLEEEIKEARREITARDEAFRKIKAMWESAQLDPAPKPNPTPTPEPEPEYRKPSEVVPLLWRLPDREGERPEEFGLRQSRGMRAMDRLRAAVVDVEQQGILLKLADKKIDWREPVIPVVASTGVTSEAIMRDRKLVDLRAFAERRFAQAANNHDIPYGVLSYLNKGVMHVGIAKGVRAGGISSVSSELAVPGWYNSMHVMFDIDRGPLPTIRKLEDEILKVVNAHLAWMAGR